MEGVKGIMAKSDFWTRVMIDILIIIGIILIIGSGISIYLEQTRGYGILGMINNEANNESLEEDISETDKTEEDLQYTAGSKSDLISLKDNFDLDYDSLNRLNRLVEVEIRSGMSGLQVASLLDEAGVISYEDFAFLLIEYNLGSKIVADEYLLEENMAIADLFAKILLN